MTKLDKNICEDQFQTLGYTIDKKMETKINQEMKERKKVKYY